MGMSWDRLLSRCTLPAIVSFVSDGMLAQTYQCVLGRTKAPLHCGGRSEMALDYIFNISRKLGASPRSDAADCVSNWEILLSPLGIIADLFASEIERCRIMRIHVVEVIQKCWDGSINLVLGDRAGRFIVVSNWLLGVPAHQSMFFCRIVSDNPMWSS